MSGTNVPFDSCDRVCVSADLLWELPDRHDVPPEFMDAIRRMDAPLRVKREFASLAARIYSKGLMVGYGGRQ